MLSGSVALSTYILPRSTRSFDFIVNLKPEHITEFIFHFKEGYYCEKDAVSDAIRNHSMFNVIDYNSGFKADFVILKNEKFRQTEFERRIKSNFFGTPLYVVSPEDLLLSKLIWIQELQSNIQMDDIKNLSLLNELDWPYINRWIKSLNINTFNLLPQ